MNINVRALLYAAALLIAAFAGKEAGLSSQANFAIMSALIATFIATQRRAGCCGKAGAR
ncbi:hypothetical protein [Sphingomicrobium aestuariivivum]|uniref:hypothetical protein n=1 Tax=Sphingomicrobium aestuariivivum TaxID=1582356 RepID=UPI001FD6AA72|nr:hypothetical protein [Sphingomicrobium aestuariivivum]MCJ8190988.1 hypothetical protein [Sphingomicrobium aestuariivivum]